MKEIWLYKECKAEKDDNLSIVLLLFEAGLWCTGFLKSLLCGCVCVYVRVHARLSTPHAMNYYSHEIKPE